MPLNKDGAVKKRYHKLEKFRTEYEQRAEDNAKLTIPRIFPPKMTGNQRLPSTYQSLGAQGVNKLTAKIHLALFPPGQKYFRWDLTVPELEDDADARSKLLKAVSLYETKIAQEQESARFRAPTMEAIKHLLVTGNVLLYFGQKVEMFNLRQYVVRRAPNGTLLECIIEEMRHVDEFSEDELAEWELEDVQKSAKEGEKTVPMYTRIRRDHDDKYRVTQEINGHVLDTEGVYPEGKLPYRALRFFEEDGKDYSAAFVEDYQGDLRSLEGLNKAVLQGSIAAARILHLVDPASGIDVDDVLETENGGAIQGRDGDITLLQANKSLDFNTAEKQIDRLEKRLGSVFLLHSSVQRPGERVTAEEIRRMIEELEDALGGIYTTLSNDLQLPAVLLTQAKLIRDGVLNDLPKEGVDLKILTGLDALGRSRDMVNIRSFINDATLDGGIAEHILPRFKIDRWVDRVAAAHGVDISDLMKTEQEIAEERQQQLQQQIALQTAPEAAKGMREAAMAQTQQPE